MELLPSRPKRVAPQTELSWILWPSREARNEGIRKAMDDPRLQPDKMKMPFDGRRMMFGGFEPVVEA
jgi:uncharacterized protein YbaA (DUF1428 family)